VCNRRWSD